MGWSQRFMDVARMVAQWSKDPNTKVGAVAVDANRRILETGYNGFPRHVEDRCERMERPQKYLWTAHAEENLVAHAARDRLEGATVYITHMCCATCTRMLINAGVKRVIIGPGTTSMPMEQFDVARTMLMEAGVEVVREPDNHGVGP